VAGYRVESRIGAGGMAVVLRARDETLGRTVALKVLAPGLAGDAEFRERFVREARAVAAVDHPHIIPVYAAGEANGLLYLAMRYVAGGDLRAVVQREGPLSGDRAITLLSPIASALDAAHAAGLVHRDVKLANILIDAAPGRPEHPYLSDFGLAKGAAASATGLTGTGQFLGTPDYAAPEQISGKPARLQTDQYALACVVYSVLTAALPFPRDESMAVLWAHMYEPPPSLTASRPDLPAAADSVLARALAKAPDDRYASCGEFTGALHDALITVSGLPANGRTGQRRPSRAFDTLPPSRTQTVTPPHSSVPPDLFAPAPMPSHPPVPPAGGGPGWWPADSEDRLATSLAPYPSATTPLGQGPAQAGTTLPALDPAGGVTTTRGRHMAGPRRRRLSPRAGLIVGAVVLLAAGGTAAALVLSPSKPNQSRLTAGQSPAGKPTARASASSSSLGTAQGAKEQPVAALPNPAGGEVLDIAFGSGGVLNTITAGKSSTSNGNSYSFDLATRSVTHSAQFPEGAGVGSGFSADGKLLVEATGCGGGCGGSVLDAASGQQVTSLPPQVTFNGYSLSDMTIATANADNNGVTLWSLTSGASLATLTNPDDHFQQGSGISANGEVVAVNSDNGGATHHIYVWNVTSQTVLDSLTVPTDGEVENPDLLSSDGKTLAVGIISSTRIYDAATGRLIRTLPAALGALSPDGTLVATPVATGIQIWDVATGKVTATLQAPGGKGPSGTVPTFSTPPSVTGFAIAFSPDGKSVAAGYGSTTYVWNLPGA
jgi:serine/threonine protein kinase/WD40 repeat protein